MSEDEFKERLRNGLVSQSLVRRMVLNKVVVTRNEIDAYYREHSGTMPSGRVRIALLIYPSDANAEKWAQSIGNDKNKFMEVAREITVGPTRRAWRYGLHGCGGSGSGVENGCFRPGGGAGISSGFHAGEHGQICLLERAEGDGEDASIVELDEATRARIEEILAQPRLQARLEDYLRELRSKALVDIRE